LRRVPDGRERIADLVRDRGGEATQGHELHLLRLLAHASDVLDEYHGRRRVAATDRHEVHLELTREAGAAQLHERRGRALAPGVEERGDLGRVLGDGDRPPATERPEELHRARIVLADATLAV